MSDTADPVQLEFAAQHGWTILSHNKRDYQFWHRAFVQQGRIHGGIILLPRSPLPRLELRAAMTLDWIDQCEQPMLGGLLLWNHVQYWLNRGFVLRGYTANDVQRVTGRTL